MDEMGNTAAEMNYYDSWQNESKNDDCEVGLVGGGLPLHITRAYGL